MNRYTFVIHVHADGPSTLENLSTEERIQVSDLAAVGPQIERWVAALPAAADGEPVISRPDPAQRPASGQA
jgi:hypothetical protein